MGRHKAKRAGAPPQRPQNTVSITQTQEKWREKIKMWYPDWEKRMYCVPPVFMSRVMGETQTVEGQSVFVVDPTGACSSSPQATTTSSSPQAASTSSSPQAAITSTSPQATTTSTSPQATTTSTSPQAATTSTSPQATTISTSPQVTTTSTSPQAASSSSSPPQATSPSPSSSIVAPPHESDVRGDFAQQHVLCCMQKLGDELNETMFVISQLEFSDYLKKPAYAAAARLLPKPETLSPHLRRGDFDLLVIHRSFGILVGELKALGLSAADAQKSQAESDADLVNRLERAVKQLAKSDTVLRHLTADVAPSVMIRMTVILPYVPLSQLQRVLGANAKLSKDLCACLGAKDETEACQLSLCAEQFSSRQDPLHVDQQTLNQLKTWWSLRMARTQDPCMSSDVYLDLLARFCGPATSVTVFCPEPPRLELRTEGEAVSEVGRRLAHIVLTLQQVDLLHRAERLVCVTGPPGTGKSLLLVLMGLKWLRRGKDVHVVSTKFASFAASRLIEEQLKKTLSEAEVEPGQVLGTVHFHHFDFWNRDGDIDNAIRVLKAEAKDSELYVLMDEVSANQDKFAQMYGRLVSELGQSVQDLHIWAAAIRSGKLPPAFHVESVTVALRCTPAVLQEITWVLDKKGWAGIHKYDSISVRHLPTVGPGVKHLSHEGPGHSGDWPTYCVQCGKAVGKLLKELGIAASSHDATAAAATNTSSPPPLTYGDVFVLTRNSYLQDDVIDETGQITSPASGFVQGLRAKNIPVQVISDYTAGEDCLMPDLSVVAQSENDKVLVGRYGELCGLERKVVVSLGGRSEKYDGKRTDEELDEHHRVFAMSRCSAQLIVVDVPATSGSASGGR